ncbi:nuclear poly(A) polymerase 1-like [Dorcoceras hygrometricum]|uniref:Nuclear poly(A) polymerase 1-like n=1 Tax=Dorcoceras hygrometricum TaxID=472368 RepID=A0A2Z7BNH0_9LAMI|nr:nuclear poly(A) polymerase 1-like [Dorcoceras hygrometricum]
MAPALISNIHHISFDSVIAMDDAGLVAVFEALVATGFKDFLGCPAIYYEAALTEVFENSSDVTNESRVKRTPAKKAVSKKRPAVAAAEPIAKKKRKTKGKLVSSKENLEILPVAQEAVPLQIIEPTPVAPAEQPSVPKRKSKKRRLRLPKGSDDENVETPVTVEITGETVVEQESAVQNVIESVDVQREETAVEISEEETDFHARQAGQPVVTASDIDEDIETIDVGTGVVDQQLQIVDAGDSRTYASIHYTVTEPVEEMEMAAVEQSADEAMSLEEILMTIPVDCPLPSAEGEVTKIQLVKSISIPGVHEGDWYKASLPKIPATDKGKALLQERDPVKGNPVQEQFSLIVADIDLIVQLREHIIDEVDKFFNSFSLKKLAALQTDDIYTNIVDIRNFVSSIAEDRSALRVVQSVNRSVFVSPHVQSIASSAVEDQHVQRLLDQCPFSSSSSDDSSMHFVEDDIQLGDDAASTQFSLPTAATHVPDAIAQLRASIDQLHFEKNLLSLDLKSSQQKLSTQVAAAAFDTIDVRKEVKELNAKVTFMDGQVAAIRSEFFDFRSKEEENHLNLSTQLGFLVDYINRGGDAKKGEGGSSHPQPPPDDQSRPSGGSGGRSSRPNDQSIYVEVQLVEKVVTEVEVGLVVRDVDQMTEVVFKEKEI